MNRAVASTTYCTQSLSSINLRSTGTYAIGVIQFATSGSATIGLNLTPPPVTAVIQPGGPPVTVNIPVAGQAAQLFFHGGTGQKISISVSRADFTNYDLNVSDPNGNRVMGSSGFSGGQNVFIDTTTLVLPGKYTIAIVPGSSGVTTGNIILQVNNDLDVIGTITPGGAPVTATTTVPGQDARLTFFGTAGQKISSVITNVANQAAVSLVNPDGSVSGSVGINTTGGPFWLDTTTLPSTGKYALWIQHAGSTTGSETLQLYSVPDLVASITASGPAVTATTTIPGQDVRLRFSGTAGEKVSLVVNNITTTAAFLVVSNTDGTNLTSITRIDNSGSTFFLNTFTLPNNGTYTVWISHILNYIGSETVQLYNASDISGAITLGGPPVTETTVPGQDVRLTFSGTAGQKISMVVSNVTNQSAFGFAEPPDVNVLNPDGTTLATLFVGVGGPFYLSTQTLPSTGTYTLWIQHVGAGSGSETLQLYDASDVTGTITANGPPVNETTVPGQDVRLTFSGTSGQQISLTVNNATGSALVYLLDPTGSTMRSASIGSIIIGPVALTTTGTYTVWIQHQGGSGSSETLQIYNVTTTATTSINGSPSTISFSAAGQNASLTFNSVYQQVTVHVTNNSIGPVSISLYSYTNQLVTKTASSSAAFDLQSETLFGIAPGYPYQISINPAWTSGATAGSITVTVTSP
jgi:hypothetical protein